MIPLFTSHYSMGESILTFDNAPTENGPSSIVRIIKDHGIKKCVLVESKMDGFFEAYKNINKIGAELIFGVKLVVCSNHSDKSEASRNTESKVIVFAKNTRGYHDLIRIYNRAWTENFYYYGRTSWEQLSELWTDNLTLALPFFSSFIAVNATTFNQIVPKLFVKPILFREVNSGTPFEQIINKEISNFNIDGSHQEQDVKSIYYKNYDDFRKYVCYRAIMNRAQFSLPKLDGLCSRNFCFEDFHNLSLK